MVLAELNAFQPAVLPKQIAIHGEQIPHGPFGCKASQGRSSQRRMIEICQQVMRQVVEQDKCFLGQKAAFAAGRKVQALFVVAELFHFAAAPQVIEFHGLAQGVQLEGGEVETVPICAFFQAALQPQVDGAAIIDGRSGFAYPGIPKGCPAGDLFGQQVSAPAGEPFDRNLIAATQQPAHFFVGAKAAIQAPVDPLAPGRG